MVAPWGRGGADNIQASIVSLRLPPMQPQPFAKGARCRITELTRDGFEGLIKRLL
jgi:hypothetical protein